MSDFQWNKLRHSLSENLFSTRQMISQQEKNHESPEEVFSLRALVNTKEAGIIIGAKGKNVTELRSSTGVKAGVSKVIPGIHERILTISGELGQVARAFALIAQHLIENPVVDGISEGSGATLHLLVSHHLMGSIIGRGGSRIRDIQEQSGCRIVIGKDMLSQSTERIIEVYGIPDSMQVFFNASQIAVYQIGECCMADVAKAVGTILYSPTSRPSGRKSPVLTPLRSDNLETKSVPIPVGMVGCIIGKGGEFITKIRSESGSRISISKYSEADSNQRTFTVTGPPESNQKALEMLFEALSNEKSRRINEIEEAAED